MVNSTFDQEDRAVGRLVVGAVGARARRSCSRCVDWSGRRGAGRNRAGALNSNHGRCRSGRDTAGACDSDGLVRGRRDVSTVDVGGGNGSGELASLHVAGRARQGDERAAVGVGAGIHTSGKVSSGDPGHAEVTTSVVDTTLNSKGTVDAVVCGAVGVGAGNGLVARLEVDKGSVQVVDAQTVGTTTVLGRVAGAWRKAVTENTSHGSSVGCKRVAAETLVAVFQTSIAVALVTTVVQAAWNIDAAGPPLVGGKGTVAGIVATTTDIVPTVHVAGIGLGSTNRGSVVAAGS